MYPLQYIPQTSQTDQGTRQVPQIQINRLDDGMGKVFTGWIVVVVGQVGVQSTFRHLCMEARRDSVRRPHEDNASENRCSQQTADSDSCYGNVKIVVPFVTQIGNFVSLIRRLEKRRVQTLDQRSCSVQIGQSGRNKDRRRLVRAGQIG